MPLTLLIVSLFLLLGLIVGGVIACRGVLRAEDGYEDNEGFHPAAPRAAPAGRERVQDSQADAAGAG